MKSNVISFNMTLGSMDGAMKNNVILTAGKNLSVAYYDSLRSAADLSGCVFHGTLRQIAHDDGLSTANHLFAPGLTMDDG